jgi:hypothetical protein
MKQKEPDWNLPFCNQFLPGKQFALVWFAFRRGPVQNPKGKQVTCSREMI